MPVSLLLLYIVLVCVATARITRLITRDKLPLIGVPREAFVQRWGVYEDTHGEARRIAIGGKQTNVVMSSLAYLWECDWCTSMWVGAGLTYLTWRWPETLLWVMIALAASYVTGWGATAESCVNRERS